MAYWAALDCSLRIETSTPPTLIKIKAAAVVKIELMPLKVKLNLRDLIHFKLFLIPQNYYNAVYNSLNFDLITIILLIVNISFGW